MLKVNEKLCALYNNNNNGEEKEKKRKYNVEKFLKCVKDDEKFWVNYWRIEFLLQILNTIFRIKQQKQKQLTIKNSFEWFLSNCFLWHVKILTLNISIELILNSEKFIHNFAQQF